MQPSGTALTRLSLCPCIPARPTVRGSHGCVRRLLPRADQKPPALLALACTSLIHLPGDPSLRSGDSHSGLRPANSSTSTATDAGGSANSMCPVGELEADDIALRTREMVLRVLGTRYFSYKSTATEGPQPGLRWLPWGTTGPTLTPST